MPDLIRLYIRQCLLGFALGIILSMALVILNVANIGYLIDNVEGGWLAFGLLSLFNGLVFAGVHFGITIMRMGDEEK
ncbi:MAG: hypothetical protein QNJ35_10465 [Paracoccaceae bacterium]|nr:hypothetical protein [Paracoccaceae bacterium]